MQSIEYVSVEEVIRPKTLLSLEVRVNSVDHVSLFFAPVETTRSLTPPGDYSVATATKSENKSGFVKEFLSDHPDGNVDAVNKAWAAAGMNGAIGATLIYKTRSEMGLSGNLASRSPRQPPRQSLLQKYPRWSTVQARLCLSRSS